MLIFENCITKFHELSEQLSYDVKVKYTKSFKYLFYIHNAEVNVIVCLGLTLLSTFLQPYHDGVWLRQGAQCSLL